MVGSVKKMPGKRAAGAIRCTGDSPLSTQEKHNNCEILFDWTVGKDNDEKPAVIIGDNVMTLQEVGKLGGWTRSKIVVNIDDRRPVDDTTHERVATAQHLSS